MRRRPRWLALVLTTAAAACDACIFEGAALRNHSTERLKDPCLELSGRSVALYFSAEWCPLCRRFTPALQSFHDRHADRVAIIFVSSDASEAKADAHYQRGRAMEHWYALGRADPLTASLKRMYGVWSMREMDAFRDATRRSGVPCVVVIDRDGKELAFLQGERWGAAALNEWEPAADTAWPHSDEL